MASTTTPTPALTGGKDTAQLLAALKALEAQLTEKVEVANSPTIYTESCPTGTVACDPKEAAKFGLSCPPPQIANKNWIIATLEGTLCVIPDDMEKLFQVVIPGYSKGAHGVDAAINALSQKIVATMADKDVRLLQKLVADVRSEDIPVFRSKQLAEKDARTAGIEAFAALSGSWYRKSLYNNGETEEIRVPFNQAAQSAIDKVYVDRWVPEGLRFKASDSPSEKEARQRDAENFLASSDAGAYALYEGRAIESFFQEAIKREEEQARGSHALTEAEKSVVEKALLSLRNALVTAIKGSTVANALPKKLVSAPNRLGLNGGTDASAPALALAGGAGRRSSGRSRSPRRSRVEVLQPEEEKRRAPAELVTEVRVSPRHSEAKRLLEDEGYEIATYRTAECPASYDGRKFVKAKGAYPECEKLMGFRWVSPNGRCYPEGLCNIAPEDMVHDESIATDKMNLLAQLVQVNNGLNVAERDKFIERRSREMAEAYNKTAEGKKPGGRKNSEDFREEAKKALPYHLRELPVNVAVVDRVLPTFDPPKDITIRFGDEVRIVKQSFQLADILFPTETERTTKAEEFVKASMLCAKASLGTSFEKRKESGNFKASVLMNDDDMYSESYGKVNDHCVFVDLGEDALWMPKQAAIRRTSADVKIRKAFESGDDPLGKAYKYVADKFVASLSKASRAQASAYSPRRT
jgi:hypothetical protein